MDCLSKLGMYVTEVNQINLFPASSIQKFLE